MNEKKQRDTGADIWRGMGLYFLLVSLAIVIVGTILSAIVAWATGGLR